MYKVVIESKDKFGVNSEDVPIELVKELRKGFGSGHAEESSQLLEEDDQE